MYFSLQMGNFKTNFCKILIKNHNSAIEADVLQSQIAQYPSYYKIFLFVTISEAMNNCAMWTTDCIIFIDLQSDKDLLG